ncbi:MAG TPA: hypothetical protein VHB72_00185 [Candidatus Saccharimonadales bacterium]|nr:hypothetical protein [Candidatus Saccharimonadales bacterium]
MANSDKPAQSAQPGQVISPGSTEASSQGASLNIPSPVQLPAPAASPQGAAPPPQAAIPEAPVPAQATQPAPQPAEVPAAIPVPQPQAAPAIQEGQAVNPASITPVSWTASEFIAHEKNPGWYAGLIAIAVVLSAAVYVITKDMISTIVVVVCALALGVLANRKPRQLQYGLNGSGISIGSKHFDYGAFKSFSVVPEGAFSSIVLTPLKRFAPLTTIYYAPEDEDKILGVLSSFLPLQEQRPDAIDTVARRLRF